MRILALFAAALAAATVIAPQWIEGLFGVDPDQGSGAIEVALVVVCVVVVLLVAAMELRRARR